MEFIIAEQQNATSYREGTKVEAKDLAAAKRLATKNQMFQRACLKIESVNGDVLAIKDPEAGWTTYPQ